MMKLQHDRTKNLIRIPLSPTRAQARRLEVTFGLDVFGALELDPEFHIQLIDIFDASRQLPSFVDGRISQFRFLLKPRDDSAIIEFTLGAAEHPPANQDVFSIAIHDPEPRSAQVLTFLYDDDNVIHGLVIWHASHFLHPSLLPHRSPN